MVGKRESQLRHGAPTKAGSGVPFGGRRPVPPPVQWRWGVDAEFRRAEEVTEDAAAEAALESARADGSLNARCVALGLGSLDAFLDGQSCSGFVLAPAGYPRRAAWSMEPDTGLRFLVDSEELQKMIAEESRKQQKKAE